MSDIPESIPREWHMSQALHSVARLNEVLLELTEAEVMACLELESGSRRRPSIIARLIKRAVRLKEVECATALKLKYLSPRA